MSDPRTTEDLVRFVKGQRPETVDDKRNGSYEELP